MPYQSTPADRRRAYVIGAVYLVLVILLGTMLFLIWPPIPWPGTGEIEKDKARLAKILKDSGCPQAEPATSPATGGQPATQTPSTNATGNNNQPGTQPQTTTGTQPATAGGGQTRTPATGPPATGQPATTQPAAQPANQNPASGPTTSSTGGTTPTATAQEEKKLDEIVTVPMNLLVKKCVPTTFDERLLLLVIVVGMLGAFVHGATSLADYLGNNAFNKSWTWFYLLRPAIGMSLALVFYFAIRGGFLSTTGGAKDINPYGIAALAGMVGMFSKQATDKLSEVFGTLFRSAPGKGDAQREDSLNGSTDTALQLEPASVVAGGNAFLLTVTGTGFVNGATININDQPLPTTLVSATTLTAQVAKETIANAGTLKLLVVNGQNKIGPVDLVVTASGGETRTEQPVSGEGGDEDLIDGCDVDMKPDTPDEDLPITEGGVK
ncbi:MAG TPA: hypothetical protein VFI24_12385 [Pyrinomonadaceae bacterium]|nr:hypothetical protein [Pyrinomonadaceae bacterium]